MISYSRKLLRMTKNHSFQVAGSVNLTPDVVSNTVHGRSKDRSIWEKAVLSNLVGRIHLLGTHAPAKKQPRRHLSAGMSRASKHSAYRIQSQMDRALHTSRDCHLLTPRHGLDCACNAFTLYRRIDLFDPFSSNFVDALCMSTAVGFICTVSDKTRSRGMLCKYIKVSVSIIGGDLDPDTGPNNATKRSVPRSMNIMKILSSTIDRNSSTQTSLLIIGSKRIAPRPQLPLRKQGL